MYVRACVSLVLMYASCLHVSRGHTIPTDYALDSAVTLQLWLLCIATRSRLAGQASVGHSSIRVNVWIVAVRPQVKLRTVLKSTPFLFDVAVMICVLWQSTVSFAFRTKPLTYAGPHYSAFSLSANLADTEDKNARDTRTSALAHLTPPHAKRSERVCTARTRNRRLVPARRQECWGTVSGVIYNYYVIPITMSRTWAGKEGIHDHLDYNPVSHALTTRFLRI